MSRTSNLSNEDFRDILHNRCKDFCKSPKLLQRSKDWNVYWSGDPDKFSIIDPKKHERKHLNTNSMDVVKSKHHILLMDNLPSWSKFPKRSQSVIGLTMEDPRAIFGSHRFLVIPFDSAKFGVAPSCDLWGCKTMVTSNTIFSFNDDFSNLMKVSRISDKSYSEMISDLQKEFNEFMEFSKYTSKDEIFRYNRLIRLFYIAKEDGLTNIEDALDKYFGPEKFKGSDIDNMEGFNLMNYTQLSKLDEYDFYEFWTDSECLLYYLGKIDAGSEIENEYNKFVDEFIK